MSVGLLIACIILMTVAFASPVKVDSSSMVAGYEVSTDGLFTASLETGAFINAGHIEEVGWRMYPLV